MSRVRSEVSLSIGELADRVGASHSALRYWERAGLLDDVTREGGRRRYPPATVERVGMIRLCQDAGFGISEIRALLASDPLGKDAWKDVAGNKLAEIEERISHLQDAAVLLRHTLDCPAPSLAECETFAACVRWRADGAAAPVNDGRVDGHPGEQHRTLS